MSTQDPSAGRPPSEEELRAAYEEEMKRIRVDDVLVQTVVTLLNLGGRRAGLVPGSEDERDLEQVRKAVEGARALMPLVEPMLGPEGAQLREALSQLQMAYVQLSGGEAGGPGAEQPPGPPGEQPPARQEPPPQDQRPGGGRLWVPGQ